MHDITRNPSVEEALIKSPTLGIVTLQRQIVMAGGEESLKLLGYWASPFALRVTWALKLKEVPYRYIEDDPRNKSELLLRLNPVHKKVPILVHNGKPVAESLVILEYIEETWRHTPLLPLDPYERAKARFWAKFADDKCVPSIMEVFSKKGEEQERAIGEARENLKILEGGFEGKRFFGGETIHFTDVAVGWLGLWARIVEEIVGVTLVEPSLAARFREFLELPTIRECVPPWEKLLEHNKGFHRMLNMDSLV